MTRPQRFLSALRSLYQTDYLGSLVVMLQTADYSILRYLQSYWSSQDFSTWSGQRPKPTVRNRALLLFVYLGALLQTLLGVAVLVYGLGHDAPGIVPFGLAIVVSYPVVWAHMLALKYLGFKVVWAILHPKTIGRMVVCTVLEWQAVRLRRKHSFTVIAVAGSVGKTSTKLAIAHTLEPTRRVIYQTGNYNDRVTVPLVLFGQELPGLLNAVAWSKVFLANERTIRRPFFYDIAVLEIGTDHPGNIADFAYLQPDVTIVTAITPEHMEYFGTLDAVAAEELAVCDFSKQVLVNVDDTEAKYLQGREVLTFGTSSKVDFRATDFTPRGLQGTKVQLQLQQSVVLESTATILGEQGIRILLAAAAAAQLAGLNADELTKGLKEVRPFAGRMQILPGIKDSTIIDDSYNASPEPVKAALDVLYAAAAPQRIAILGTMNELGDYSAEAHTEVGEYCRSDKLDLVVTIGADAEKYLAPAARTRGCETICFTTPYDAGAAVLARLKQGAVILVEGSQNGVFAEESLKVLLADATDAKKLVRQSKYWMDIKRKQFGPPPTTSG